MAAMRGAAARRNETGRTRPVISASTMVAPSRWRAVSPLGLRCHGPNGSKPVTSTFIKTSYCKTVCSIDCTVFWAVWIRSQGEDKPSPYRRQVKIKARQKRTLMQEGRGIPLRVPWLGDRAPARGCPYPLHLFLNLTLMGEDKPSPLLWTTWLLTRSIVEAMACPRPAQAAASFTG